MTSRNDNRAEEPVFVLGCAWRCGSTLLQRLLNATGELFIWGEHAGMLGGFAGAINQLRRLAPVASRQSEELATTPDQAWIANVCPDPDQVLVPALREMLLRCYEPGTTARGLGRWGFKEVRYDAFDARLLLELFPDGRTGDLPDAAPGRPAGLRGVGALVWIGRRRDECIRAMAALQRIVFEARR